MDGLSVILGLLCSLYSMLMIGIALYRDNNAS